MNRNNWKGMLMSERFTRRTQIVFGLAATILLSSLSVAAIAGSGNHSRSRFPDSASCKTPSLPGTIVKVVLVDMGGPMMGQGYGMMSGWGSSRMSGGGSARMSGGAMRLRTDHATVAYGTVSFVSANFGHRIHEMVILPLADSQVVGTRPIGGDGKIDEAGSLGESSKACGEGAGEGITPGASGWVTATLAPGRYELVCNLPGHYAAGMYSELTVS
jgi:uncharacterized cupredoxin-like copper-binding protein